MSSKIVETGIKIDLHIHSVASHFKDGKKVKELTIENIGILIKKLNENQVNMCAITDHDNFDYNIYKRLKEEENKDYIKKVLPGVEFSVAFGKTVVHVITIFEDTDEKKLKEINSIILNKEGNPDYDEKELKAFSEKRLLELIRTIGLNVIMIAHQKGSLSTQKEPKKNDVLSVGQEKMEELIFVDYFDTFEFFNRKNEIFNKCYLKQNSEKFKKNDIRFITGSDCHNWDKYPDGDEFVYTYLKCLPTFRGLAMAVTDYRRIKHINSFFSSSEKYVKSIDIQVGTELKNIELSKGLNVIIGDNSIGKSLLIHKLTEYRYLKGKTIQQHYDKYLKDNNIILNTNIEENKIYAFDKQGAIREKFEKKSFKNSDFLSKYFSEEPNILAQKGIVIQEVERFINNINDKKEYKRLYDNLNTFSLYFNEENSNSILFNPISWNFTNKEREIKDVIDEYEKVKASIEKLMHKDITEQVDVEKLSRILNNINKLYKKYKIKKKLIEFEKEKINIINNIINKYSNQIEDIKTDVDKARNLYVNNVNSLKKGIVDLISKKAEVIEFKIEIEKVKLNINKNLIGDYRFICKANIEEISKEYVLEKIKQPLKRSNSISDINNITVELLEERLPIENEQNKDIIEHYKTLILKNIDDDFKCKNIINDKNDDITKEMSAGFNSKIYFDILSYQKQQEGIYIIDQPEDDVSQTSIKKYLLDNFKQMSNYRQVILITHNPQFIINLDVDNVVFLSKTNGDVDIKYGALEYEGDKYKILDIVSSNIDGGIDVINERWKRYEKNI